MFALLVPAADQQRHICDERTTYKYQVKLQSYDRIIAQLHSLCRRLYSPATMQVCLDLVCNVHIYRKQHSEVEVFARFLEEFYGPKELCFFL